MYQKPGNCEATAQRASDGTTVPVSQAGVIMRSDVPPDDREAAPEPTRRERCLAALLVDPRPCESRPDVIRVIGRTGQGTTACLPHGAVLLASLDSQVRVLRGERPAAAEVRRRAGLMRPFDGVWTGPGVQRMNSLEAAAVFPSAPYSLPEPCLRSSGPGNARRARWVAGQRYQAGDLPGGAADNLGDVAWRTASKEVETR
jgi:hypothetical protein